MAAVRAPVAGEIPEVLGDVEPAWEIALLFPPQGMWTESEYLALPGERRVELSEGRVEVLPMPTEAHQDILFFLAQVLNNFLKARGLGKALPAGVLVRLWEGKIRLPDVVAMLARNAHRRHQKRWEGADLVVEIVSDDKSDRERDLVTKRAEYALAGISEYWIVDPEEERILVLALEGEDYRVHGEFRRGEDATSLLLPGFSVAVDAVLDSAA